MDLAATLAPLHNFFLIVSFVFGALVGSFANVCIGRWPHGESVISPRSRCPKCKSLIAWHDNIPMLSWLLLRARCRNCGLPISWQYPAVEFITGLLFLLVFWRFGFAAASPIYMGICAALVIVTFQDLTDWTIPNEITFPGIFLGPACALIGMTMPETSGLRVTDPLDALAGLFLGGAILYSLDRITVLLLKKPGMGFGDVKLLAMLGAFLGWWGVLFIVMFASIIGTIAGGLTIFYFRNKADSPGEETAESDTREEDADGISLQGHYLPFGPYLALAGLLYLFVGPEMIQWYIATLTPAPLDAAL
ncbi:MAG: prepilin peptidase [Candidatus Hydrogenedentes bacterium]|nr:prepilin peptidase [Candidatus Hydrogenedentota bacterium]